MPLVQILTRNDTAANWTTANPVLEAGEIGAETDTGKLKVGNGVTNWAGLSYVGDTTLAVSGPPAVGTGAAGSSTSVARADHTHSLPAAISCSTVTASGNVSVAGTLTVTGSLVGGSHTQASSTITDWAEAVQDTVAAALVAGDSIAITYNDAAGTVTIGVSGVLDGGTYTGTNV